MSEHSNRQQLFEDLVNARRELMRSLLFLSEQEAMACGGGDDWCVRDVISHITARECTALAAAQHLAEEGDPFFPDPLGDDEFNQTAVRRRRDLALRDVIDELDGTRRLVLRFTRKIHNNELYGAYPVRATGESRSVAEVLQGLVEHDYLHASEIWQGRAQNGLLHRAEFRYVINDERNRFMSALGGMFEQDMFSVEVCGYWTVKDVMAHMLSWDEEILRTAEHWTVERPWQYGAHYDDEWNESEVAKRAEMDVIALADGLATCQRKLMQLFDQLSDQDLGTMSLAPWGERMSLLSFLHEMALHNSTHRENLEALRRPAQPRGRKKR
jgi:uncharacterized damage-inducible protein DinB